MPREGVCKRIGEQVLLTELPEHRHRHPLEKREGEHLVEQPDHPLLHLRRGRVQPGGVSIRRYIGKLQPVPDPLPHLLLKVEARREADGEIGPHPDAGELGLLVGPLLDEGFRVLLVPGDQFKKGFSLAGVTDEAEEVRVSGDEGGEEVVGEAEVALDVEELLGGDDLVLGHHEELAELGEDKGLVAGADGGFEFEEGAEAGGGAEEGDGLGLGLDAVRIEVEEVGVAGEEGLHFDGEAEAFAALLEVAEGNDTAGLVEDLADDAGAEAPPLVALDGGVQEAVLAPGYLEAGDGGGLVEEGRGPWGTETIIFFSRA